VFTRRYEDVIYISANPHVRSNRIRIGGKIRKSWAPDTEFEAEDHFYRIIDVWNKGWNDDIGTVLPETVNRAALDALYRYPDKKLIVHYLQPHFPYITLTGAQFKRSMEVRMAESIRTIQKSIQWRLVNLLGTEKDARFGRQQKLPSTPSPHQLVTRTLGLEGLKKSYEDNLRIVINHIARLIDHLEGRIVITSDHGELLGEEGQFGHSPRYVPPGFRSQPLLEVPWLEVERPRKVISQYFADEEYPPSLSKKEEEDLKRRLKALGYL